MLIIQICPVNSIRSVSAWHCIHILGQLVKKHSNPAAVTGKPWLPLASDVIDDDSVPRKRWNIQWLQQASGLGKVRSLQLTAWAVTNVVAYLLVCISPEETAVDSLGRLGDPQMASQRVIMHSLQDQPLGVC
jgi:hypothetical protein